MGSNPLADSELLLEPLLIHWREAIVARSPMKGVCLPTGQCAKLLQIGSTTGRRLSSIHCTF